MQRKGFTLIELLIVVAIIAILAAIAVPNFLEAQVRAKVSRAQADMRSLATAIEAYRVDSNKYPSFRPPGFYIDNTTCPDESPFLGRSTIGTGECGVSSRLMWVTTPVSYITSVFPEAFSVNNLALGAVSGDDPKFYDTYDFVSADSFSEGGALDGVGTLDEWGSAVASGGGWRLSSSGPDLIQAFGGRFVSDGPNFEANVLGADYDPTNGTVSAGDIVRIGGSPTYPSTRRPYYNRQSGEIDGS